MEAGYWVTKAHNNGAIRVSKLWNNLKILREISSSRKKILWKEYENWLFYLFWWVGLRKMKWTFKKITSELVKFSLVFISFRKVPQKKKKLTFYSNTCLSLLAQYNITFCIEVISNLMYYKNPKLNKKIIVTVCIY